MTVHTKDGLIKQVLHFKGYIEYVPCIKCVIIIFNRFVTHHPFVLTCLSGQHKYEPRFSRLHPLTKFIVNLCDVSYNQVYVKQMYEP